MVYHTELPIENECAYFASAISDCVEQQQQRITRENTRVTKPDGLQCWYCKKHKSLRLCTTGKLLHAAYTAALHRRNRMGPLDHSNPEQYDAWLAMNRALLAYWGHQFEEPIDDNDESSSLVHR